jgi:hypothetical protein
MVQSQQYEHKHQHVFGVVVMGLEHTTGMIIGGVMVSGMIVTGYCLTMWRVNLRVSCFGECSVPGVVYIEEYQRRQLLLTHASLAPHSHLSNFLFIGVM